jgi:dienelactone hydrolase
MKILLVIAIILTSFACLNAEVEDDFVEAITNGRYQEAESYYSPELANALQKGKLEFVWQGILRNTGDFEVVVESKRENREDFYSVVTTLKFENVYMDMVLTINQDNQVSGLFFRPSEYTGDLEQKPPYVDESKIIEEDVEFDCKGFKMYGTLTVPKNQRSFPIVIMATGSGPNDRDEKIGANKPFKNIAQGLGGLGVATLRYDKRTLTHGAEIAKLPEFNIDNEYTEEVAAAIDYLSTKYAGRNIYYLGHSMGAFMAPRVMNKNSELRGVVMLAANARPLEDLVLEQTEYIMVETGDVNAMRLALIEKAVAEVKKINNLEVEVEEPLLLDVSKEYWLSLNQYDPLKEAKNIKGQVLIVQGQRDYQVTMTDFNIWRDKFANNKSWHFKSYEDLNHLFMSGQGKSLPKEYMKPAYVAEEVITDIARFINNLEK